MKCKYCGAEMPEEANYCARCARLLKNTIPVTQDGKMNTGNSSMPETTAKIYTNTRMSLSVMVVGFISLAISIVYLRFTGIFGIVLGIIAVANGDSQMKKAIVGILCSGIAIAISTCLLAVTMDSSFEDSAYQTGQMAEEAPETLKKKQAAVSPVPTQKATPEAALTLEEKVQKALQNGQTAALKNYSKEKTDNIAGKLLESLSFKQTKDYDIANWESDETKEYIICTQEAFPRAGKYSLDLIPTGNKITLSNYQGFEREVSTYTVLSEKDKAEYDNLTEEEFCQREIKHVCEEFTE